MTIIEIWPKGYADRDGPVRLTIADDADAGAAAREAYGSFATVFSTRPAVPPVSPPVSEAHARTMSRNDNS